jgi:hypothetical protein
VESTLIAVGPALVAVVAGLTVLGAAIAAAAHLGHGGNITTAAVRAALQLTVIAAVITGWAQLVVATAACSSESRCSFRASAGVLQWSVLRGLLLRALATAPIFSASHRDGPVPLASTAEGARWCSRSCRGARGCERRRSGPGYLSRLEPLRVPIVRCQVNDRVREALIKALPGRWVARVRLGESSGAC